MNYCLYKLFGVMVIVGQLLLMLMIQLRRIDGYKDGGNLHL
ncbi:unnamed protein product [Meloidogyne enterolobii]|uniref:Uncharacterized protein n=1 Tax=Meloidogyne enterolobii TaxID=390850 RepID=A0ACB1A7F2_MELEN